MTEHRIRIIQPRLRDGDIAGNLAMTLKTIRASAGQADLLVFPETCISGFPRPDNVAQLAEPLDGPSATALREAARQAGVAVAIGLAEADQGRRFNAGLLIDADGQVLLHYRKTMLYDSDQGVFEEYWPTIEFNPIARVNLLGSVRKVQARTNSVQAAMKPKRTVMAMAGRMSGNTTSMNARCGVAPSTIADSSRSRGKVSI